MCVWQSTSSTKRRTLENLAQSWCRKRSFGRLIGQTLAVHWGEADLITEVINGTWETTQGPGTICMYIGRGTLSRTRPYSWSARGQHRKPSAGIAMPQQYRNKKKCWKKIGERALIHFGIQKAFVIALWKMMHRVSPESGRVHNVRIKRENPLNAVLGEIGVVGNREVKKGDGKRKENDAKNKKEKLVQYTKQRWKRGLTKESCDRSVKKNKTNKWKTKRPALCSQQQSTKATAAASSLF